MGLFDRLLGRTPPAADPRPRPRPAGVDAVPPTADTLVVYALDAADGAIDARTPCLVVLDFDPVDVRRVFEATDEASRADAARFTARLASPGPLRDPNSRGRLEFVRRWLIDHAPPHVAWRLEPAATAGSGG